MNLIYFLYFFPILHYSCCTLYAGHGENVHLVHSLECVEELWINTLYYCKIEVFLTNKIQLSTEDIRPHKGLRGEIKLRHTNSVLSLGQNSLSFWFLLP